MKRNFWLMAMMGAVLLSAASVLADDGFYVIAGGGKAGTQINAVPYTISSPGLYCLSGNLTYTPTTYAPNAIFVDASDVTIDLMGFSITGPGKTGNSYSGIRIGDAANNVEIRNGTIKSFPSNPISCWGINNTGVRLIGLRVRETGSGILLSGGDHLVMGCSIINTSGGSGIYISKSGLIKGNHLSGNLIGINVGPSSCITGNICQSNIYSGIVARDGSSIMDNTVSNNGTYGIDATAYSGLTIMRNTSRANTNAGISTGNNCTIKDNTTQGLAHGTNCTVVDNTLY